MSSLLSGNLEGEKICFSSTPLYHLSDHQDVDAHIELSNHGCSDILLIHLIMILIHSLSIFLSHWPLTINILMKWKPLKLSRHFSVSRWLCQVLATLSLVPLLIRKQLNHPRLLITLLFALKMNLIYSFHILHQNHMILSLMHYMSHTQQVTLWNECFSLSSCFLICQD